MVETIHQVKPFKALTAMRGKPIKKAKKRKPSYDDSSEEVSDIDWAFESDDMVKDLAGMSHIKDCRKDAIDCTESTVEPMRSSSKVRASADNQVVKATHYPEIPAHKRGILPNWDSDYESGNDSNDVFPERGPPVALAAIPVKQTCRTCKCKWRLYKGTKPVLHARCYGCAKNYRKEGDERMYMPRMSYNTAVCDTLPLVRITWYYGDMTEGGSVIALVDTGSEMSSLSTALSDLMKGKRLTITPRSDLLLKGMGGKITPVKESISVVSHANIEGAWLREGQSAFSLFPETVEYAIIDSGFDMIISTPDLVDLGLADYLPASLRNLGWKKRRRKGQPILSEGLSSLLGLDTPQTVITLPAIGDRDPQVSKVVMSVTAMGRTWKAIDGLNDQVPVDCSGGCGVYEDVYSETDIPDSSTTEGEEGEIESSEDETFNPAEPEGFKDEEERRAFLTYAYGFRSRGGRWRATSEKVYRGRTSKKPPRGWRKKVRKAMAFHAAETLRLTPDDVWGVSDMAHGSYADFQDIMGAQPEEKDPFEDIDLFLNPASVNVWPIIREGFSAQAKAELSALFKEKDKVFVEELVKGGANVDPLTLVLKDPNKVPRPMAHRRFSTQLQELIDVEVKRLLEAGIIRQSLSRFSSELVMTKQKDKWRMCVDFTEVNRTLETIQHPLPNIRDILDSLAGKKFIGKMDLRSGYHQFKLSEASSELTAFRAGDKLYEYTRIPFGLKMAPAYFQSVMQKILGNLVGVTCFVYVDDIIVFGDTEEGFVSNMADILTRLEEHGVVLRGEKCVMSTSADALEVLGYQLNDEGVTLTNEKKQGLLDIAEPRNVATLRSFNGLANYFRPFIQGFATMMKPLTAATSLRKWEWTKSMADAFTAVKRAVGDLRMLHFIDESLPLILRTDASMAGLGGVLFQRTRDGQDEIPIAFVSKAFNSTEQNWSTIEQEGYGIFYCVMKLQHYLKGRTFTVETDHRNLVYMASSLTPKVIRWKLRLLEYDFVVRHIAGVENVVADALSRCLCTRTISGLPGGIVGNLGEVAPTRKLTQRLRDVIGRFHNPLVGHFKLDKTMSLLRKAGCAWVDMEEDVKAFLASCPTCQKLSAGATMEEEVYNTTMVDRPFRKVSFDTVGPLPADENGNEYIIVAIDCFSRVVELKAVRSTSAKEAARFMLEVFGRYGPPEVVHSDRGTQFVNRLVEEFMSLLTSRQSTTLPYRPQANGICERVNGEVMRHLRAITMDNPALKTNWSDYLPLCARIINYTYHSAIGTFPAKLLYGINTNGTDILVGGGDLESHGSYSNTQTSLVMRKYEELDPSERDAWVVGFHQTQRLVLAQSQLHQSKLIAKRIGQKTMPDMSQLKAGDYVVVQYPSRAPNKLAPKWRGPMLVTEQVKANEYRVQHLNDASREETLHVTRLRKFDATNCDPELAEMMDKGDDRVDCIVDHHPPGPFQRGKRLKLDFKVRWVGYGSDEDTWIPYREVKDNEALEEYMAVNGLTLK